MPIALAALALAAPAFCASAGAQTGADFSAINAALSSGDAAQAEQLAEAALVDNGLAPMDRGRFLVARGTAREAQARHDDALVDLTQAIEMHVLPPEEQARALFTRGAILDVQGHANDAIGDYSAALILSPRYAPALNNRANDYRRLHHVAEAKRDYLAALAAGNPAPEYSYYGLGQIAEAEGNRQGARGFYTQAVAANPNYQLAADRLVALGGALVGAAPADTGIIHLHPPGTTSGTVSGTASGTAPDNAPDNASAPVVLKPPGDVLQLHPPRVTPASYSGRKVRPGLRPALDAAGDTEAAAQSGAEVQLGAWRTEAEAGQGWNSVQQRSGGLLDGLSPHIVAVDLPGKGRYYRLRVAPVADSPAKLCAALKAQSVDCIPARD